MSIIRVTHRFLLLAIAAAVVAATTLVNAQAQATEYTVVSSFDITFLNGRAPSSLRQASDGTFYGTTSAGGLVDKGTLFRMDATGIVTSLESFSGPTDGGRPFGLARAADGRFYGLTAEGGTFNFGTVFRFVPGGVVTTLHEFSGTDSRSPVDLFPASDGNVYGLTAGGGAFGNGTIFMIDPGGNFRTIYSFDLSAGSVMRSLVKGSDGRFYVTAERGGAAEFGTLFTVDSGGRATILHSFEGRDEGDGEVPAGLIQGRDGRLYGTTLGGGKFRDGTAYSIGLAGDYRVLHSFNQSDDGSQPSADLLEASDGNFYGVSQSTFAKLFRIDSSGTLTTLHNLGALSPGELIQGVDGKLYGPIAGGGPDGGGTIIRRDSAGTLTTFYEFRIGEGAGRPNGVIQARNGLFYGTTTTSNSSLVRVPVGTVFSMDATGARTTLHTFESSIITRVFDGTPLSNLFEGTDGNLYGTTFNEFDAPFPPGQIFKISPGGDYTRVSSSYLLRAGVIQARDGRLYGTAAAAGQILLRNYGNVFKVDANGTLTVLHVFEGADSANSVAELVEIDDGTLYGTTAGSGVITPPGMPPPPVNGTIFQVDPVTGAFFTRYRFTGPDGSKPMGRLIQATDGRVYGTTVAGGQFGFGTIFSFDRAGVLATVHHFSGPDGANPSAGVMQGLDGRLYGTTTNGGVFGYGTVFALDVTGGFTTLHDLAWADGAYPDTELIQASDGAFYGSAPAGGPTGGGVIFSVRVGLPPVRYFEIVSRNSGKCLDVFGQSLDAAAPVIQWPCHRGQNQQWRLEPVGASAFRIIARHSGQVLDVYGALVDDVIPIIQYPVHGGDNQVWTIEQASDGYVRIVARHSGKAMDVELASKENGTRIIQYTPHGGANQQWLLRGLESTATSVTTAGDR